ncbi:hypothetical protein [Nocardia sp. CC201C]|uniref:hypothetical protein n=1 Tax=Nocardia sp. CC201C TaxID=3044575 RepID=UPI0024A7DF37|nr:hypothetical protein [Nocardia sp. CC201C]
MPDTRRDQLAAVINPITTSHRAPAWLAVRYLEAIVAANWQPPAREIPDAAALVHEADGTVIRLRGGEIGAINTASGRWPGRVHQLEPGYWISPAQFHPEDFPARVLWEASA